MVLHKLRVTTWVFSLLVDVNVYIEPIRRGCSVFCKNVNYSNMSTKVLSKTYIRSYIHAHYQEGLVGLLQQASFDSWLSYPTRHHFKIVFAHESTNHQHNAPLGILPRHPTRGPSFVLTLILSLLVVTINLSMNCIGNQVVHYRGCGCSNSFISCRGVLRHTCFHHLASAHDMCSADFKRKPTWV